MPTAVPPGLHRRAAVAALLVALLAVALAACSGDADADTSSSTTAPVATADRDAYVRAVRAGVGETIAKGGASDDQVACIAAVWVDVIGTDAFASRQITPDQVAASSFSYGTLGITDAQADRLLDAFGTCGVDLVAFTLDALAPLVDEAQFACIAGKVSVEEGRAIGRGLLVGGEAANAGTAAIGDIAASCGIDLG
ncbi:MAG: hypothetical protein KF703_12950 [Actinobacteria bacterium]|nr:hypothetical protein [Actinomycetota bacterium]